MMHLIITVLAILLAALVAVGGINYFKTDVGNRLILTRELQSQRDAILAALASHRIANDGRLPHAGEIPSERLGGYLPRGVLPGTRATMAFQWRIAEGGALCVRNTQPIDDTAVDGVIAFARKESTAASTVVIASECVSSVPSSCEGPDDGLVTCDREDSRQIAVSFLP